MFAIKASVSSVLVAALSLLSGCASQPAALADKVAPQALAAFNTPGMAVAVVHQGKLVQLAGYGQRDINAQLPVTPDTYFRLASASKAFTAASLAILVDEGKLRWDDKLVDLMPEFQLQDPWVSAQFTVRDLLAQRSGLVSGAGDSMLWPEPSGFSRQEVIASLAYLTPEYSFRNQYSYSNVLYITAGELVARLSGIPYAQFVEQRIFAPLQMSCYAGAMPAAALDNTALGYDYSAGQGFSVVQRNAIAGTELMSAAAGGIVCSAEDMSKWLQALLASYSGSETALPFSRRQLMTLWQPHTLMGVSEDDTAADGTHFSAYGLGWRMADMHGVKLVHHTGTLSGYQAYVALVPELQLGIVILNNGSDSGARSTLMRSLLKQYLAPDAQQDWVVDTLQRREQWRAEQASKPAPALPQGSGQVLLTPDRYSGVYRDSWFGDIRIELQAEQQLRFYSVKMPTLRGSLQPFDGNSFVISWDDANAQRPALIHFTQDEQGQVDGFSLQPYKLNPGTRHEYRDMAFIRLAPTQP